MRSLLIEVQFVNCWIGIVAKRANKGGNALRCPLIALPFSILAAASTATRTPLRTCSSSESTGAPEASSSK